MNLLKENNEYKCKSSLLNIVEKFAYDFFIKFYNNSKVLDSQLNDLELSNYFQNNDWFIFNIHLNYFIILIFGLLVIFSSN